MESLSLEEGSSVLASIHDIQKQVHPACVLKQKEGDPLFDYTVNLNNLRKIIYISAEVRPDSLHKGFYPTDEATTVALAQGRTGDCAGQYIGQQLGGGGHPTNVFPLNQMLDTGSWKADEDKVYAHVKQGESARLKYGIEYEKICSDERSRPTKIYYHFQLLGNDQVVSETIEGVFENTSPRITNPWKKQFA